jgi:hypothetical protein
MLLSGFRHLTVFLILLFISSGLSKASGIRGTVKSEDGEPLAFTTIFVKQTGSGTTTNSNGSYEISLQPGEYEIVFQFLGYETLVKNVTVTNSFVEVNVVLKTQVTMLQTVTVKSGSEDPAYTIMRKAIAKAKYHTQQIDKYSARVYIKGTGQLIDYPWLAKKQSKRKVLKRVRSLLQSPSVKSNIPVQISLKKR